MEELFAAIEVNDFDQVKRLIEEGANLNERDEKGHTPLTFAARKGTIEIADYLLLKGCDINEKSGKTADHWTPLICALFARQDEMVRFLIEKGADLEAKTRGTNTALLLAANYGYQKITEYLLDAGANLEAINNDKDTPLLRAILTGKYDMAKYLLQKGSNVSVINRDRMTPLKLSIKKRALPLTLYLLKTMKEQNKEERELLRKTPFKIRLSKEA